MDCWVEKRVENIGIIYTEIDTDYYPRYGQHKYGKGVEMVKQEKNKRNCATVDSGKLISVPLNIPKQESKKQAG